jgi:hypothetical protein
MKFSRLGACLASLYLLPSAICVGIALGATTDPKGNFVFLQLPIALQLALLDGMGLGPLLSGLGWASAYLLIAVPTAMMLYLLGSVVAKLFAGGRS